MNTDEEKKNLVGWQCGTTESSYKETGRGSEYLVEMFRMTISCRLESMRILCKGIHISSAICNEAPHFAQVQRMSEEVNL